MNPHQQNKVDVSVSISMNSVCMEPEYWCHVVIESGGATPVAFVWQNAYEEGPPSEQIEGKQI